MLEIELPEDFKSLYSEYIRDVSPAAMALSLQALQSIWNALNQEQPIRILEYGSGISTALLAMHASTVNGHVKSYDSDENWCAASQKFLELHNLGTWVTCQHTYAVIPAEPAQFIIWDYDKNPMRVDLMASAFANLEQGGVMYVDDMHSNEIKEAFHRLEGAHEADTPIDGFGRYGSFVRKT